ncbi:hypothetical protein VTJ49DRAFT_5462 [Mycothermus thermophilus]|uniref:Uncharacterized protein n=1 Tax=Humicola insolens TaxID=85995 RepID=A0ABR3V387_HUMIN
MVAVASLSRVDPLCLFNSCVEQVAGLLDSSPVVYYEACTLAFGAPSTTTYTVDSLVYTATKTEMYTDIIITLSTTTDVSTTTARSSTTISDVATVTSTVVVTETQTRTVTPAAAAKKRTAPVKRSRRGCAGHSPVIPSPSTDATASSTSTEVISATASPIPSNCANLEEFSSACQCITAVSDVYVTVTVTEATSTGTITANTESTAIPSTSTVVEIVVDTTTVTERSTITIFTRTTTEVTTSTTTAIVTATDSPNIEGWWVVVSPPKWAGKYLTQHNQGNTFLSDTPNNQIGIPRGGGQPFSVGDRFKHKMFVHRWLTSNNLSPLLSKMQGADGDLPMNCSPTT